MVAPIDHSIQLHEVLLALHRFPLHDELLLAHLPREAAELKYVAIDVRMIPASKHSAKSHQQLVMSAEGSHVLVCAPVVYKNVLAILTAQKDECAKG